MRSRARKTKDRWEISCLDLVSSIPPYNRSSPRRFRRRPKDPTSRCNWLSRSIALLRWRNESASRRSVCWRMRAVARPRVMCCFNPKTSGYRSLGMRSILGFCRPTLHIKRKTLLHHRLDMYTFGSMKSSGRGTTLDLFWFWPTSTGASVESRLNSLWVSVTPSFVTLMVSGCDFSGMR